MAVLRDIRTTGKCTIDRALVPSAPQSSKAEFYGTRDVISRALSVAVLRSEVYSLCTLLYHVGVFSPNFRLGGAGNFFSTSPLETGLTE